MAKFVYLYSGGSLPDTKEGVDEMMGRWGAYAQELGDHMIDFGAPFGDRELLGGAQASALNGYSIIEAADLAEAKALAAKHPHIADDGALEIAALGDM